MNTLFDYLAWPVTVLLGLVLFIYLYGTFPYWRVSHVDVPYTKPWPWIGNLLDMKKHGEFHHFLLAYRRKHGPVFKYFLGRKPVIVVTDPEMIKQIMIKEFPTFQDRRATIRPKPPLGSALFVLAGEDWKRVRSTITPSFTGGKLKKMVPLIEECIDVLLDRLAEVARSGKTVDVQKLMRNYALDVIMSVGLGTKVPDLQTNPDPDLLNRVKEAFQVPWIFRFISILPVPYWLWPWLGVSFLQGAEYFVGLVKDILHHRQSSTNSSQRNDVIDLLLNAHHDVIGSKQLSTDEVIAQSMVVLLAGQETTTNTFTFIAYCLATNPGVQDRLLEEIDAAWSNKGDKSMYELIHDVPYLSMVIKEVLRLYPATFNISRVASKDTILNGLHIPANVDISVPVFVLHREPDLWPEPEKFDPERFSPEAEKNIHPCQNIPFGVGPRQCVGMRLAMLEIKSTMLNVLKEFRFEAAPETPQQVELTLAGLTLSAKGGIHVKIKKRV